MQRQPVESSMLRSAGYDAATSTLELEFTSGRVYQYFDVPQDVFDELLAADSKGRYFLAVIDHAYPYQQAQRRRHR